MVLDFCFHFPPFCFEMISSLCLSDPTPCVWLPVVSFPPVSDCASLCSPVALVFLPPLPSCVLSCDYPSVYIGPFSNRPLHPTPPFARSRGGSAILRAVPKQRVWSGAEGEWAIKPSDSESALVLTWDRSLPDRSHAVCVRQETSC